MKQLIIIITIISFSFHGIAQSPSFNKLVKAINKRNTEKAKLLIKQVDLNKGFKGEGTPLILAVRSGNLDLVKFMVYKGANVNLGIEGDGSPLIEAAKLGHLTIVKYLISKGANIDVHIMGDETPLIRAAGNGHLNVVKYLIEKGANINKTVRDSYSIISEKRNAIRMARKGNHQLVVNYLIAKGAKG